MAAPNKVTVRTFQSGATIQKRHDRMIVVKCTMMTVTMRNSHVDGSKAITSTVVLDGDALGWPMRIGVHHWRKSQKYAQHKAQDVPRMVYEKRHCPFDEPQDRQR